MSLGKATIRKAHRLISKPEADNKQKSRPGQTPSSNLTWMKVRRITPIPSKMQLALTSLLLSKIRHR